MATRYPGEFKTVTIDRSFCEKGKGAIHMSGATFIYSDGSPVRPGDDVDWLPEPFRTQALAFVQNQE